ncbi:sulfatase [Gimesia aquarii]|uniref:Arylsulfatase n=1 Tax=Gimesia aquarii TaxID=2527964 RepID=A0A517WXY8_9PLAN|nr:sulfatase [Gimesia aquarii]QDU10116.1 Arylsulfatase [Gimesia aquarii]
MNRCITVLSVVAFILFSQGLATLIAAERPNILWIIAEDMGPELSCYGTPEVKTPTLDRLAEKGMLFKNAFTVTPVCSTSRSSFMTGMYAMSIDAHNHRSHREGTNPLPDGVRVITDWLRPAGYTTANIRKLTKDRKLSKFYKGTGKTDWNFTYPKGKKPFDVSDFDELKNKQPFYAQINFSETHRGGAWNTSHQHIDHQADPAKVKIPDYYPEHPVTRAVWAQYLNAVMAVDKKVAFILDLLKRDQLDKNTIVIFLGDHGRAMPRGKQWPYDSGLHIPLIVYWPENNSALPVPANYKRGEQSEQLISAIDLSATTLALAGVTKPEKMQGQVFLGSQSEPPRTYLFSGRDRGDETVFHIRTVRNKRYRYLRSKYPERPFLQINRYKEASYPIIGLLRHLHSEGKLTGPPLKLMAQSRPKEELYDLENDPWETKNLANSAEHQVTRKKLALALDKWMEQIDDKGRIPEDPAIPKFWDERSIRVYTKRLESRPDNWFEIDSALGPYKIQEKK